MALELPPLPYDFAALEPHIDAETMRTHHGKHHQAYVNNYNKAEEALKTAVSGGDYQAVVQLTAALNFNGGGHANHSLFWSIMAPAAGGEPKGDVRSALDTFYGGFTKFRDLFSATTVGIQGSGWGWLCWSAASKSLVVTTTANQDSPKKLGLNPILGLDVWEHAYYLKYKNDRAKYVEGWWNVVNWRRVEELFAQARG